MSLSGPTEFEAVAAGDGPAGTEVPPGGTRDSGAIKGRSLASIAWRRLRQDKLALVGAIVIVVFVLVAVFADVIQGLYGQSFNVMSQDIGDESASGHR